MSLTHPACWAGMLVDALSALEPSDRSKDTREISLYGSVWERVPGALRYPNPQRRPVRSGFSMGDDCERNSISISIRRSRRS